MSGELSTYADLADVIEQLPTLIRARRRQDRMSLRAAAEVSGVGFTTLARVEQGLLPNATTVILLLRWLDRGTS